MTSIDNSQTQPADESIVKYIDRLRILHQIERALIAGEGPEAIAGAALPPLRDLLGVRRAIVNLFDLATGEVEWLAAAGRRRVRIGPGIRYSMEFMGNVEDLKRGNPQSIDVHALPPGPEVDALLASGVDTYMVVPMIAQGELIGALSFGGAPAPFSTDDIKIAQEAAAQFALALTHARLHERVKNQAQELEIRVRELRESENLFRNAFEHTLVPMVLTNIDHRFLRVNAAFAQMFGYSQSELLTMSMVDITHPDDLAESYAQRERLKSGDASCFQVEKRYLHKNGHILWGLANVSLIRDLNGQPLQYVGQVHDITERKQTEEALRQSELQLGRAQRMEAFGQLAGGVAHDFNNVLTIITGYCEVLLGDMVAPDKQRECIREIRKAGERAASFTRQLLAFSRKQMLQPVELDLNAIVADIDKMLRRLIGEDIDLATALDPDLKHVKADPGQIEQVIMNLVFNARDAMPTGGHLTIETRNVELDRAYAQKHAEVQPGKYVMLAVTDSGCGMDDVTRARIFEPFFTTKEPGKGTGLGLATVHGIVKQSGGSIEVYSEVGHGTTFKVYLPRLNGAVPSAKPLPGLLFMPRGTETILLAEDEEGVRATVCLALEFIGYTVLAARNGDEALQLCKQHADSIHLLMTDVVMPQMSGRQLADLVVALRPNIKVLYLSGYTDDAVVRHGVLEAEMAFLQKPFTPLALARKIREVLGNGIT